jgi:hypothetical protein
VKYGYIDLLAGGNNVRGRKFINFGKFGAQYHINKIIQVFESNIGLTKVK